MVLEEPGEPALLYVDLHLVHEVTSAQAFEGCASPVAVSGGRGARSRRWTTTSRRCRARSPTRWRSSTRCGRTARSSTSRSTRRGRDTRHRPRDRPELGLTQPGKTIVCGDSHTSTHGAFGALAIPIGTSEVEHVLATQTLQQRRPKTMLLEFVGELPTASAKDLILGAIGQVGVDGGVGYVVEYTGDAIRALSMEQRMTVCNMSIEWGARAGMIAPDETTFAYLEGREFAPAGADWERRRRGVALARERPRRLVRPPRRGPTSPTSSRR